MHFPKIKEKIKIKDEYYYFWLSYFCNITFVELERLLQIFSKVENIYKISNSNFLFKDFLLENNVVISKQVYSNLLNSNLKEKSIRVYKKLVKSNVNFFTYKDLRLYSNFYGLKNYEFCLIGIGKHELLHNKNKIMVYNNFSSRSSYTKMLKNTFYRYIDRNCAVKVEVVEKIEALKKIEENTIYILNFKINENMLKKLLNLEIKESLIILSKYSFKLEYINFNIILISSLIDKLIVLEAGYNEENVRLIDSVLDASKDIFVVPGNILSDSNYFSNYLIKSGAEEILSIRDIKNAILK